MYRARRAAAAAATLLREMIIGALAGTLAFFALSLPCAGPASADNGPPVPPSASPSVPPSPDSSASPSPSVSPAPQLPSPSPEPSRAQPVPPVSTPDERAPAPQLPVTGDHTEDIAAAGAALILCGLAAIAATRRHRTRSR